jgi:hypothetical protein
MTIRTSTALLAALALVATLGTFASSCKTTEGDGEARTASGAVVVAPPMPAEDEGEGGGESAPDVQVVSGFGFDGASACLGLAEARTCLPRPDALADACTKAGGTVTRCEDCSGLCSAPVAAAVSK